MKKYFHKYSKDFAILKLYLIGWFIASLFWRLLRESDLSEATIAHRFSVDNIVTFLFIWILMGTLFGLMHILISRFVSGRVKYYQLVLLTLILQLLIFFFIIYLLLYFLESFLSVEIPELTFTSFINESLIVTSIYILIVNFCIDFVRYVSAIIGKNNLLKMLSGKFYKPSIVKKIFMFVDLKGSTQLAESLGHIAYSNLIQDCFKDLVVIHDYQGEIYQYVGDEAVIIWDFETGVKDNTCIKAFFAFYGRLHQRAQHYLKHYKSIPEFKAGLHGGIITMTEVGDIKRDLAYHGDTINTAARLQGECNRLNAKLLISEDLLAKVDLGKHYTSEAMGEMQLRGKNGTLRVYSIDEV